MVDTTCTMSMHSQDRSLLTNIVNRKKETNLIYFLISFLINFFIAIKKINRVNREIKLIALIAINTRLICSSNKNVLSNILFCYVV